MRRRSHLTADEWRLRLDECMARVLAAPERFEPCVRWLARWRRAWLTESGSLFREPAERAEVADAEGLTGPSSRPPAAGGPVCARAPAATPEKWPKTPERGATTRRFNHFRALQLVTAQ
jgi:hypothetical protein